MYKMVVKFRKFEAESFKDLTSSIQVWNFVVILSARSWVTLELPVRYE